MTLRAVAVLLLTTTIFLCRTAASQQHIDLEDAELFDPDAALFGDLGRVELSRQGYLLRVINVNHTWGNTMGGNYRGVGAVGNQNVILNVDTERAGWWKDGEIEVFLIGVYGRRPSLSVGDYQFTSAIDAFDTVELFEVFYEHHFSDSLTILAGLHDFTVDFAVIGYGMSFINSSFFTPATITQRPYSFYPTTGLGARALYRTGEHGYVMAGIYDGQPTNPNRMRAHDWGLTREDGAYTIAEAGWVEEDPDELHTKVAAGAWHNSGRFVDINDQTRRSNAGAYLVAEQEIWQETEEDDQGFGLFFQGGQAQSDRNFNSWYFGSGLRYKGLFEGRDNDVVGLAYNLAQISSRYRSLNEDTDTNEQVIEFSYRAEITPYLTLTPDIQYVFNPGANRTLKDSLILYLQSELAM